MCIRPEVVVVDDQKILEKKETGVLSTMFPKSWLHPGLIAGHSHINETDQPFPERHHQMLSCPLMIFLLYDPKRRAPDSDGDFLGIMSLGCVLENMWLMAAFLIIFHLLSLSGWAILWPQLPTSV